MKSDDNLANNKKIDKIIEKLEKIKEKYIIEESIEATYVGDNSIHIENKSQEELDTCINMAYNLIDDFEEINDLINST